MRPNLRHYSSIPHNTHEGAKISTLTISTENYYFADIIRLAILREHTWKQVIVVAANVYQSVFV